jgi:hypothetical protein
LVKRHELRLKGEIKPKEKKIIKYPGGGGGGGDDDHVDYGEDYDDGEGEDSEEDYDNE